MNKLYHKIHFLMNTLHVTQMGLLIRHAEKQLVTSDRFGNEAGLTPYGVVSSQMLERKLHHYCKNIYSSPLKRCVMTGQQIAANPEAIITSTLLGDPGVFVEKPEAAGHYFLQHTPQEIAQRLLSDQVNPNGFCRSTADAVYCLMSYLITASASNALLSLFITHDIIVAMIVAFYFGQHNVDALWPDYLQGLLFWQYQNNVYLYYQGNERVLTFAECYV